MRHVTLFALPIVLASAGCFGDDDLIFSIELRSFLDELEVEDSVQQKTYTLNINAGQVSFDEVELNIEGKTVLAFDNIVYDFTEDGSIDKRLIDFNDGIFIESIGARITLADALGGVTLFVSGEVTLTDQSVVNFSVSIPAPKEELVIQEIPISIQAENFVAVFGRVGFLPERIFADIDFDALGAGGADIVIEEGTENPAIDAALQTIQANLLTSFTAD